MSNKILSARHESQKKVGFDFRHIQVDGYGNINTIYPQKTQLHACETLFGDFEAEVLLLAQDASDFESLENSYILNKLNPFRHSEKLETNKRLFEYTKPYFNVGDEFNSPNARSCGVYYANSIWLLKKTNGKSGQLKNLKNVFEKSIETFEATLDNLPKLKLIITLGKVPYKFLNYFLSKKNGTKYTLGVWNDVIINREIIKIEIKSRQMLIGATYHPGSLGTIARARASNFSGVGCTSEGIRLIKEDFSSILEKSGFKPHF